MNRYNIIFILLFFVLCIVGEDIIIHTNYSLFSSTLSGYQTGHGIEDVNHELIGRCSVQMIFGEGFEELRGTIDISGSSGGPARTTWWPINVTNQGSCEYYVESGDAFTGLQSQAIRFVKNDSICGIDNLGLDSQGMYFGTQDIFDFAIWVKVLGENPNKGAYLNVSLIDTVSGLTLDSSIISLLTNTDWVRYNLTLTNNGPTTNCSFNNQSPLVKCYTNAEGLCPSCSGVLRISIDSSTFENAIILLDQVYLAAASGNARGPSPGAPATRADVASLIAQSQGSMGLTALRLGGSAILVDGYRWKRFRGQSELRQPYQGFWYSWSSSSWGFFEFLELCESLNISLCVVTMNSQEVLQDIDDFVEYVYGDSETTFWGAQRAADGHLKPYHPFAIEIGNENDHTDSGYIALVSVFANTLRLSSLRLNLPFLIPVCIGVTPGVWPPASILPLVSAIANTSDVLELMIDFHIGGDFPTSDPEIAYSFISSVHTVLVNASLGKIRGAVLEENGGRHDVQRGLGHARNANRLRCLGDFVRIETAANGFQVLGRNDNGWDQGALFITQNSTYLSPHGMVNIPLSSLNETGAAIVPVESTGPPPSLDIIAIVSADGHFIKISAVNVGSLEIVSNISLLGCTVEKSTLANVIIVAGDSLTQQNLPGQPLNVYPEYSTIPINSFGFEPFFPFTFKPFSVTSIIVECNIGQSAESLPLWQSEQGATTCDAPTNLPKNFTYAGLLWNYFNNGPWQVSNTNLSLFCGATDNNCFDEAISIDGRLLGSNGTVSVNVTFSEQEDYSGDDDAGLLVRCGLSAVSGMDGFSCYEVSLGANQNGVNGSGFILIGSHFLPAPGSFQLLQKIPFDIPSGMSHILAAQVIVTNIQVTLIVSVNGVEILTVEDKDHANDPFGGDHIGLRSFYSTVIFSNLVIIGNTTQ
jgi:hypothetical protein